jgi:hypothetical protein
MPNSTLTFRYAGLVKFQHTYVALHFAIISTCRYLLGIFERFWFYFLLPNGGIGNGKRVVLIWRSEVDGDGKGCVKETERKPYEVNNKLKRSFFL